MIQTNQRRTVFSARPLAGAAAPARVSRPIAIALQPSTRRADLNTRVPATSRKKMHEYGRCDPTGSEEAILRSVVHLPLLLP
jgi:hypothetical protein